WKGPSNFTQFVGYQNITSKKYIESVGEDKAALNPLGTRAYRHVEGKQGDYHRFEAVGNHWRKTPVYRELIVRRIPDPATRLAGLRSGEIDIGNVFGDYLDQARKAGLRIHEAQNAACHWVVLQGQTTPDREDYCPACPWAGDPKDPKSQGKARKVRLALTLCVNKQTIVNSLWKCMGSDSPFMYWYYPFHKGFSKDWKVPPYDPERAKKLLAEAGYAGGFEVRVNPLVMTYALDGPDMVEAVSLDWEKIGIKVRRVPEAFSNFLPKNRARKTNKTHWVYGSPPFDEPVLGWQRAIYSKGAFNILCDGAYDEDVDTISRELDTDKRARMTQALGQRLYDDYRGGMRGMRSLPRAVGPQITPFGMLYAIHDAMVRPLPGAKMGASLAESWRESPDGLTYEFKLRPGLKFHNGDPVTAEDVKFSYERYRGAGAKELQTRVRQVDIVDALTIRFQLKEPWPDFMTFYGTTATAAGIVVPKKYLERVGDEAFRKNPIGAGPYKFVSHTPGVQVVLEAYPGYWRHAPYVKRLIMRSVTDGTTRAAMLKTGEADISYALD